MRRVRLGRPSAGLVVSVIALTVALGGTGYAAFSLPKNSVGTKQIKNNAVTTKKIKNGAVTGSKIQNGAVSGSKLNLSGVTVPNATNASHASNSDLLGGSGPSAFFPASKVNTFNVKLAFGQTRTLFSAGTLTFSAKCVQDGTDPDANTHRDFSELLVTTSQNGGILTTGEDGGLHGTSSTDFLNTDTTEANRAVAFVSSGTGTSFGTIENNGSGYGMQVTDPNGVVVEFPDGVTGAVNLFGSSCLLAGFAVIP